MKLKIGNKIFVFGKGFVEEGKMKKESKTMDEIEADIISQNEWKPNPNDIKPVESIDMPIETIKTVRPIYEVINEKAKEFKGNMKQVQDYAIANYQKEDLFSAGFQVCMIMTNNRLQVESIQREYLKKILEGDTEVPFDPREQPILSKILQSINPIVKDEYKRKYEEMKKIVEGN